MKGKTRSQGPRVFVLVGEPQELKNHLLKAEEQEFRVTVFDPKKPWAMMNKAKGVAKKPSDNQVTLLVANPKFIDEYFDALKEKFPDIQARPWQPESLNQEQLERIVPAALSVAMA